MRDEKETLFIKLYAYCNRGSALLNSFHSLGLLLIAVFYAMHLNNILWIIPMIALGITILVIAGWYAINRIDRINEKLSVGRGTHYQINQYAYIKETRDLAQKQVELLTQLIELCRQK